MAHRDYEGVGITVHWDSERCIHSERCVRGAPTVFDHDARPWVNVDGASADEIAQVIDRCPSGALSYTRTDNVQRPGVEARSDAPAITPLRDGPLEVRGPVGIVGPDGNVEVVQRATLCRCGQSGSKPFCDNSHERVGFSAPGWTPPPAQR